MERDRARGVEDARIKSTREDFRYAMEVAFLFLGLFLIIFL